MTIAHMSAFTDFCPYFCIYFCFNFRCQNSWMAATTSIKMELSVIV